MQAAEKDQAMIAAGSKKGTVRFSINPGGGVKKVQLVGDFSEWKPMAMGKQKDGSFATVMKLKPGTYEYKFIVDGQWRVDPDNGAWALNPFGTLNSVATVE
jgi:1,4-alpha-glucan branching enzyme